jgi:hypothetical protein
MLSVSRTKKILGKTAEQYTDEQIEVILKQVRGLTDACVDMIDNKIKVEGPGFLDISSKRQ